MEMHSALVVCILLLLTWNSSALPCDGAGGAYDVGGITCPEEVILVQLSEGGSDDGTFENPAAPYPIATDDSPDANLSGEIVESAANEGIAQANSRSDPLSSVSNGSSEDSQNTDDADEEAGVNTERVNVQK